VLDSSSEASMLCWRISRSAIRVKQEKKVINNAVALRMLAELAVSALDAEQVVPEETKEPARKVA
jgi:hypothetical protein